MDPGGNRPSALDRLRASEDAGRGLAIAHPGDVLGSLIAFIVIYSVLAVIDVFLLSKYANKLED